jgi:hypothetical protein
MVCKTIEEFSKCVHLEYKTDLGELVHYKIQLLCSMIILVHTKYLSNVKCMYSQTCIKRSHLGQRKGGLIRQMTS